MELIRRTFSGMFASNIKYSNCIGGFVTAVVPNRVEEVGRNRYVEVNEISTESEQKLRR